MCMQVRFVVMGNVFPTEVRLHRKYDLKGSTHGRTAGVRKYSEPGVILKVSSSHATCAAVLTALKHFCQGRCLLCILARPRFCRP